MRSPTYWLHEIHKNIIQEYARRHLSCPIGVSSEFEIWPYLVDTGEDYDHS